MTREFLKNIKSENRLDKIRLIMKNDDVIGGQPTDDEKFTSNTPFLDIACTMKFAIDATTTAQKTANEAKTAASNADKKAAGAQTAANTADGKATTADGKAVAAQKSADEAKTAAENADKKAAGAQTAANTADGKAVAAQKSADEAKTAASNADKKADGAQTAATSAQTKANQVPNPVKDNFIVGNDETGYKLMTAEQVKALLAIPKQVNVVNEVGQSTTDAISQKAFTDMSLGVQQRWRDLTSSRSNGIEYTNNMASAIVVSVRVREGQGVASAIQCDGLDIALDAYGLNRGPAMATAVIPPGSKYKTIISNSSIVAWMELR